MRNRPDGAGQADFAEIDAIRGQGKSGERRDECRRYGEIGGRLVDPVAAGDIEIDVVRGEARRRNAPRAPRGSWRARLNPSRPPRAAACRAATARPAPALPSAAAACLPCRRRLRRPALGVALAEEQFRGIGDLAQAVIRHLEDADLVGRAETVLDRAQDAILVAAIAFEIEHRIDHVLDDARAGDLAILGDMADQHHGGALLLGIADQRLSRGAHLRHGARCRFR